MNRQKKSNNYLTGFISILIILTLIITNQLFDGNLYNFAFGIENSINSDNIIALNEDIILEKDKLNVLFLYVGQADCTFVKKGDFTLLIDSGNKEDGQNIVNFLKKIGVEKLNYLVGTHSDEDHIGGISYLLKNIPVERLYFSSVGSGKWFYDSSINSAKEKNVEIVFPELNESIPFGSNVNIVVKSAEKYEGISSNNSSLVLQLTYKKSKFLFMGDCEKESENEHIWEQVDVLKVGHHGSNTSSSENFLNQVKPKYAVVQVGKNNEYRLPNKYTLNRLEKVGATILRTDTNESSFWFVSDGTNLTEKEININLDYKNEE